MKERKKTYSVAIRDDNGNWYTNWGMFEHLEDIDWGMVREFCLQRKYMAYGYYYGYKSYTMHSSRRRTILSVLH